MGLLAISPLLDFADFSNEAFASFNYDFLSS